MRPYTRLVGIILEKHNNGYVCVMLLGWNAKAVKEEGGIDSVNRENIISGHCLFVLEKIVFGKIRDCCTFILESLTQLTLFLLFCHRSINTTELLVVGGGDQTDWILLPTSSCGRRTPGARCHGNSRSLTRRLLCLLLDSAKSGLEKEFGGVASFCENCFLRRSMK